MSLGELVCSFPDSVIHSPDFSNSSRQGYRNTLNLSIISWVIPIYIFYIYIYNVCMYMYVFWICNTEVKSFTTSVQSEYLSYCMPVYFVYAFFGIEPMTFILLVLFSTRNYLFVKYSSSICITFLVKCLSWQDTIINAVLISDTDWMLLQACK